MGPSPSQERVLFMPCKAQASEASCHGIEARRARFYYLFIFP